MGSKYPSLSSSEVIRRLVKHGFLFKSQRGSHAKYVKSTPEKQTKTAIVPMHDIILKTTLKSILRQAGLSIDEFMNEKK